LCRKLAAAKGHSRDVQPGGIFGGLPKDLAKAAEWHFKASKAGNVRATANLAMMYAKDEGVRKDLGQAKLLFDEADYMGLDVSEAPASVDP
jgi:TPR repeat protein